MRTSKPSVVRKIFFALIIMVFPLVCGLLLITSTAQGWMSIGNISFFLNIAAFVVTIYVALFTGFLSWRALVFAALPRIDINYLGEAPAGRKGFHPKENVVVRFSLVNIGWWYAKPASTNTKLYLNFDPAFNPKTVHYGSNLELTVNQILRGKHNSKYFIIRGVHLYYAEIGEDIDIDVKMPKSSGKYPIWITARSDECDHGTFRFEIDVKDI